MKRSPPPTGPRLQAQEPMLYSPQRARDDVSAQLSGAWATPSLYAAGVEMLDAFIIEKIRREQESRIRPQRIQIEVPRPPRYPEPPRGEETEESERGVVIIDFSV